MSESVTAQMERLLAKYGSEVRDIAEQSCKEISDQAAQTLKNTSPRSYRGKKRGRYARGWAVKVVGDTFIVYNRTDGQLTHLLENGHVISNGKGTYGRTRPIKHIKPVEEASIMKLDLRIRARLRSLQ